MNTKFLIVDDLQESRILLSRLVRSYFPTAEVLTCSSGIEALEMTRREKPDLMLLDAMMPEMTGFEVCRRLKRDPDTASVMILMVSAVMIDTKDRVSGLESGADSYLCKPFENAELIAQIRALLRIRQSEQELQASKQRLEDELTRRREVEHALEDAKQAAEAAALAKGEFLAHMSHEIRTPMNAVIGLTELLINTDLTDEQRDFVETLQSSGETLLSIINDILDFSKIESGRMEMEHEPFELVPTLEETVGLFRSQADQKGLALTFSVAPGTPPAFQGDVTRFRQVVSNLLSNAVKFTERGEISLSFSACHLDHRRCEIQGAVRDTGSGIPPEKHHRLFQSFSQVDASTTRMHGGTGLGLAISKRLCEMMGGTIWVDSTPGKGSTFYFTVQLDLPREQEPSDHVLDGRRVLIVDDNEVNRKILVEQVRAWGVKASATAKPDEALEWVRCGDPFDAAILDMDMPVLNGLALAAELQRLRPATVLPLILLSSIDQRALSLSGTHGARVETTFAGVLTKPLKASELHDILATLFAHSRDQQATPADDPPAEIRPLRLLVAEDNPVNQKVVLKMLERIGYHADLAATGREALERVRSGGDYDVILMDVLMPELDGLETTRLLRESPPPGRRPHIIAMTANVLQGDREKCLAAGMDDYLGKPLREKELRAALDRVPLREGADSTK